MKLFFFSQHYANAWGMPHLFPLQSGSPTDCLSPCVKHIVSCFMSCGLPLHHRREINQSERQVQRVFLSWWLWWYKGHPRSLFPVILLPFPKLYMVTSSNSPRGAHHWMNGKSGSWDCQWWLRKKRRQALTESLSQWELNLFFLLQTASTLVVAEAKSSGIYSCVASNKVGKSERNVSFIVTGKI